MTRRLEGFTFFAQPLAALRNGCHVSYVFIFYSRATLFAQAPRPIIFARRSCTRGLADRRALIADCFFQAFAALSLLCRKIPDTYRVAGRSGKSCGPQAPPPARSDFWTAGALACARDCCGPGRGPNQADFACGVEVLLPVHVREPKAKRQKRRAAPKESSAPVRAGSLLP
jgi:hypothetical protein